MASRSLVLTVTSGTVTATAVQLAGQVGPHVVVNFTMTKDAHTLVGAVTVTPSSGTTYAGTITLGGRDAALFSLSSTSQVSSAAYPCSVFVGSTNIGPRIYALTLTASP